MQGSGGGKSRDEVIAESAEGIAKRIAQPFNESPIGEQYPTDYNESMNTVLTQEIIRFNKLLRIVHKSLVDVQKALKGLVVMSEALDSLATQIFNNQIPTMWSAVGYPSMKPLAAWVVDLEKRLKFLNGWVENGHPPIYWISGFFFPQAFLTGTLQNFARKHVIAIDTVSFGYKVILMEVDHRMSSLIDFAAGA